MKRKLRSLCLYSLIAAVLLFSGPAVCAKTIYGRSDWQVTFTDKLETNFTSGSITELLGDSMIYPGDTAIITIKLVNTNAKTADWYMSNKVLSSLEDASDVAQGGAYTYKLTYKDKNGKEKVLFDSDKVGGDNSGSAGEGLHGATEALKDYFFVDTLSTNQSGAVTLELSLDGETIDNNYQRTLADIQMNFAVELAASNTQNSNRTQVVRTGDETDLLPLYLAMAASGLLFLVLGILGTKKDRKRRGGK